MYPKSTFIYLTLVVLWLSVGPSSQQEAVACNSETEQELRLSFDIPNKNNDNFPSSGSIVWKLVDNQYRHDMDGTLAYRSYTSWDDIPAWETMCVPKDECRLLVVQDLAPDQFQMQLGEMPITPGPVFPAHAEGTSFQSTTQVGHSCTPTCAANESLLSMTVFTAGSGLLDWDIVNKINNGQAIVSSCQQYSDPEDGNSCGWDAWETYYVHECVPTNECYRLIWNDYSLNTQGNNDYHAPRISLSYDPHKNDIPINTTIVEFQPNHLDTVRFGDPQYCGSPCAADEVLLELLLTRNDNDDTAEIDGGSFEWTLFDMMQDRVDSIYPFLWNKERSWHLAQQCIRADACLEFILGVPETARNRQSSEEGRYLLLWDDIVFVNTDYSFTSGQDTATTNGVMIGACGSSDNAVCDPSSESLLALELEANKSGHYNVDINVQQNGLEFASTLAEGYFGHHPTGYRHYDCIPKECFALDIAMDANTDVVVRHTVTLDGTVLMGDEGNGEGLKSRYQMVSLDGCSADSDKYSAGAKAGIVIGTLAAAFACLVLVYRTMSLRKEIHDGYFDDEEDHTTSSDVGGDEVYLQDPERLELM